MTFHERPTSSLAPTRLVLPVPELAAAVPGAHIALLDPFLPLAQVDEGVLVELRELCAEVVPFALVLGEPTRFPNGAAYLPPRPVPTLRGLVQTLRHAFPESATASGSLQSGVLHLDVPDDAIDAVEALGLPVHGHAREVLLLTGHGAEQEELARFRFGTSAA